MEKLTTENQTLFDLALEASGNAMAAAHYAVANAQPLDSVFSAGVPLTLPTYDGLPADGATLAQLETLRQDSRYQMRRLATGQALPPDEDEPEGLNYWPFPFPLQ